jgi:hypothetical protein
MITYKTVGNILLLKDVTSIDTSSLELFKTDCYSFINPLDTNTNECDIDGEYDYFLPIEKDTVSQHIIQDGIYLYNDKDNSCKSLIIDDALFESMLADISMLLCGCGCPNCLDCFDYEEGITKESLVGNILLKLSYYGLLQPISSPQIGQAQFYKNICSFVEHNRCMLLHESVYGNSKNILFLKRMVSILYLGLIEKALEILPIPYSSEDSIIKESIIEKFKFKKIFPCIENLGIQPKF